MKNLATPSSGSPRPQLRKIAEREAIVPCRLAVLAQQQMPGGLWGGVYQEFWNVVVSEMAEYQGVTGSKWMAIYKEQGNSGSISVVILSAAGPTRLSPHHHQMGMITQQIVRSLL